MSLLVHSGPPHSARWQIVLADLSLILFLVCAAGLEDAGQPVLAPLAAASAPPPRSTPPLARETPVMLSVWSAAPGAISLAQWLAEQPPDSAQRLSLEITYRAGDGAAALAQAEALVREAGPAGANARVLLVEGTQSAALAQLVQDHSARSR